MKQMIPSLLKEMEQEAVTTRKVLERVPEDKLGWQPHPKSMNVQNLTTHIAELPTWVPMTLDTDELNFAANEYKPTVIHKHQDLMDLFDRSLQQGREALQKAKEEQLDDMWTLRNGDQVYSRSTKAEVIRMTYCQIVHHRAQLGVYLRLLNIPIPGSYGPSADEPGF
jgi:uncharacterized damage-inducible protein DinB